MAGRPKKLVGIIMAVILLTASAAGCADTKPSGETAEPDDLLTTYDNDTIQTGTFDDSTGNIHDYMPDLIAGIQVSAYELLPCLEPFTHSIWQELDAVYSA